LLILKQPEEYKKTVIEKLRPSFQHWRDFGKTVCFVVFLGDFRLEIFQSTVNFSLVLPKQPKQTINKQLSRREFRRALNSLTM